MELRQTKSEPSIDLTEKIARHLASDEDAKKYILAWAEKNWDDSTCVTRLFNKFNFYDYKILANDYMNAINQNHFVAFTCNETKQIMEAIFTPSLQFRSKILDAIKTVMMSQIKDIKKEGVKKQLQFEKLKNKSSTEMKKIVNETLQAVIPLISMEFSIAISKKLVPAEKRYTDFFLPTMNMDGEEPVTTTASTTLTFPQIQLTLTYDAIKEFAKEAEKIISPRQALIEFKVKLVEIKQKIENKNLHNDTIVYLERRIKEVDTLIAQEFISCNAVTEIKQNMLAEINNKTETLSKEEERQGLIGNEIGTFFLAVKQNQKGLNDKVADFLSLSALIQTEKTTQSKFENK